MSEAKSGTGHFVRQAPGGMRHADGLIEKQSFCCVAWVCVWSKADIGQCTAHVRLWPKADKARRELL